MQDELDPASVTPDEVIPDLFEPIVAARSWTVGAKGPVPGDDTLYQAIPESPEKPYRLWSTAQSHVAWEVGVNLARCVQDSGRRFRKMGPGHISIPYESCSCGFYALNTWEQLFQEHPALRPSERENAFRVYGTVKLYGKVIPATNGLRAEKAEVRSLLLPAFEPYGDKAQRKALTRQLKEMRAVVLATADTYGVPTIEYLEELTPPFVASERYEEVREREHRRGAGSNPGGTAGRTQGNPFYDPRYPSTFGGTSPSLTSWACQFCGLTMYGTWGNTPVHNCFSTRSNTSWGSSNYRDLSR